MKPKHGFTLMELMVSVALAAALATIALPALRQHWLRAHRSEGWVALSQLQMAQERHRSRHTRYAATLGELQQPGTTPQGRYQLEVQDASATGYRLEARTIGPQRDDVACNRLRLVVEAGQVRRLALDDRQQDRSDTCWPR